MNNKIAALAQAVEEFAPKSLAEIEEFRIKMSLEIAIHNPLTVG